MRATNFASWRLAVLTSLGLFQACGGETVSEPDFSCDGPQTEGGPGLYQCDESGALHRVEAVKCESKLPRDVKHEPSEFFQCTSDADCTERAHGHCEVTHTPPSPNPSSFCQYGCVEDADCGGGALCVCSDPVGICIAAHGCKIDADCGEESMCARYNFNNGCGETIGFACLTDKDQCVTNQDCAPADQTIPGVSLGCAWTPAGRMCKAPNCAIGRPFVVEGSERLADVATRTDWAMACEVDEASLAQEIGLLSAAQRRELAQEWVRVGLMEHGSIAAFARFSLQLLSVGAPASMVAACNQAMVDETLHTRLAFGLASDYAGKVMGPDKLDLHHALDNQDFESIVLNTVLEGCIGETVAAIEAREALSTVQSPAVERVLQQIAQDEQRHADLAWQFVRWAVDQRRELAPKVQRLVQREVAAGASAGQAGATWLRDHGIISGAERAELRAAVLVEVVAPCVAAMLKNPARAVTADLANA